jgi:hypothetical protein
MEEGGWKIEEETGIKQKVLLSMLRALRDLRAHAYRPHVFFIWNVFKTGKS